MTSSKCTNWECKLKIDRLNSTLKEKIAEIKSLKAEVKLLRRENKVLVKENEQSITTTDIDLTEKIIEALRED